MQRILRRILFFNLVLWLCYVTIYLTLSFLNWDWCEFGFNLWTLERVMFIASIVLWWFDARKD
jgi:hypothetical protein